MQENKTKPTKISVADFIAQITPDKMREDCQTIATLMEEVAQEVPKMWSASIVGFGLYQYKYESGRQGEWFRFGFAPRKKQFTLYIMDGFEARTDLMERLGKHTIGKSCLYINRLEDIDMAVLRELLEGALQ
jgi:nucleoid DNA-binding protein